MRHIAQLLNSTDKLIAERRLGSHMSFNLPNEVVFLECASYPLKVRLPGLSISVDPVPYLSGRGKFLFGIGIKHLIKLYDCLLPVGYRRDNIVGGQAFQCFTQALLQNIYRLGPLIFDVIRVHRLESLRNLIERFESAVLDPFDQLLDGLLRCEHSGQIHPLAGSDVGLGLEHYLQMFNIC